MKFKAAVSAPTGHRVEALEMLDPTPHQVVVRVEAANVAIADAFSLDKEGAGPPPGGPPPGGPPPGGPPPGGPPGELPPGGPPPGGPPGGAPPPDLALPDALVGLPDRIVHGHAGVGVVEAIGAAVERVKVGDRVIMISTPNCGKCFFCLKGRHDHCAEMVPVGMPYAQTDDGAPVAANGNVGSFAELALVPEIQLTTVETDLAADQLSFLANPLATGVGAALRIAPVEAGSVVAVVGCGPVGLSYLQGAKLAPADQIIGIDPLAHRREVAAGLGATATIDPAEVDPVEAVRELAGDAGGVMFSRGADFVFEAAGDPKAAEQAWAMARLAADVTLAGISTDLGARLDFNYGELAVIGGRNLHSCQWGLTLPHRDFPWLIREVELGRFDLATTAERSYSLDDIATALRDVADRAVIGATLIPND